MTKENLNQEDCECGCGHDHEEELMHLTLEDGTELECIVLGIFEVEEKEYIALMPVGDEDVFLYEYKETEEDFELISIEDEDEFNNVSEAFYTLFVDDEEEYGTYEDQDL